MDPHKCPVCDGTGKVSRPPHVPGDQDPWSACTTEVYACGSCGGSGVIWEKAPDQNRLDGTTAIQYAQAMRIMKRTWD